MNEIDYFLVDTNFLINITENNSSVFPFLDKNLCISIITKIELLGVFSINKTQKINAQKLIDECFIIETNSEIYEYTIFLKQKYKIKLASAVIAATAIVYEIPFLTFDADFKPITELKLIFLEK